MQVNGMETQEAKDPIGTLGDGLLDLPVRTLNAEAWWSSYPRSTMGSGE